MPARSASSSSRRDEGRPRMAPKGWPFSRRMRTGHDILERRHQREQPDVLEGARDALLDETMRRLSGDVAPRVAHRAARGREESGDDVEGRRLAGAVRADDGPDRTLLDLQLEAVHRHQTTEPARQPRGLQQRGHRAIPDPCDARGGGARLHRPWRRPSDRPPQAALGSPGAEDAERPEDHQHDEAYADDDEAERSDVA